MHPSFWQVEEAAAHTETNVKHIFRSSQSDIGNSDCRKVQTVGGIKYIDMSRGAFINKVVRVNRIVEEDNDRTHHSGPKLDDIKLNGQRNCSSGKEAPDLREEDKCRFVNTKRFLAYDLFPDQRRRKWECGQ